MNIKEMIGKIIEQDKPCKPFEPGAAFWTDPYISMHLLKTHLDDSTDLASYHPARRQKTAGHIIEKCGLTEGAHVLDMGCGPGLYARYFAERGMHYTGVDISGQSLGYAMTHRGEYEDSICYRQLNYVHLDYTGQFDACFMIWCDIGVLSPDDRDAMLSGAYRALNPGGRLAFDVYSPDGPDKMQPGSSWQAHDGGFWSPQPHLTLERVEYFEQGSLRLEQCIVAGEDELKTYRIWDKRYTDQEITGFLAEAGFIDIVCIDGGLSGEQPGVWGVYCQKK